MLENKYRFENEENNFGARREEALETAMELDMPESIRTPGRTWTRYPEIEPDGIGDTSPEIHSSGDVRISTGAEAIQECGEKLLDAIKTDENKLNAYHTAFLNSLIYIEAEGEADVEIIYDEDAPIFAHVVVETSESAELKITENFRNSGNMVTSFAELYLADNSNVRYGAIESAEPELFYSRRKAVVEKDASVKLLNAVFGGDLNRTLVETILKGDNSETEKIGVWYPTGKEHTDISMHVDHRGANTRCDMKSRAVVDDRARSVYEGLQHVGNAADDTSSFQDEKVLTLSEKAEIDASPKLMIEDPNVEASHAASTGNIPEDELHYMESRGLDESQARKLVVKGFFEPVMDEIELPDLKEGVRKEVRRKIED